MFFYLSQQLLGPVSGIAGQFLGLKNLVGSAAALLDIFQTQSHIVEGNLEAKSFADQIVIRDLSFAYEKDREVLKDITIMFQ
jgi:ABC-type multidrug transport system fused ATPase/permease subunit